MTRGLLQRLAWSAAAALLMLTLLVASIFLVDLRHLKPHVRSLVSRSLNADLDFSSARFSLEKGLTLKLRDTTLRNTTAPFEGIPILAFETAVLRLETRELLRGRMHGTLFVDEPRIRIEGTVERNNLSALLAPHSRNEKIDPNSPPHPAAPPQKREDRVDAPDATRRILVRNLVLRDARVEARRFSPETRGERILLQGLDLDVRNLGLDRDVALKIESRAHVTNTPFEVRGPLRVRAVLHAHSSRNRVGRVSFHGHVDLAALAISWSDIPLKRENVPLDAEMSGSFDEDSLTLTDADLRFQNLRVSARGSIHSFDTMDAEMDLSVREPSIAKLGSRFPAWRPLLEKGSLSIDAHLSGSLDDFAQMDLTSDLRAHLLESDLRLRTNLDALQPARGAIALESRRLDADALLAPILSIAKREAKDEATKGNRRAEEPLDEKKEDAAKATPPEPRLSERLERRLRGTKLDLRLEIASLVFHAATIDGLRLHMNQDELIQRLERLAL